MSLTTTTNRSFVNVPSWITSVGVHALILFVFASGLHSCRDTSSLGQDEGEFREIGIYVKQPTRPTPQQSSPEQSQDQTSESAESPSPAASEQSVVPDAPPVPLALPEIDKPTIGPGAAAPSFVPGSPGEFLKPNAIARPSVGAGLLPGETSFFGAKDRGSRFVYVLDCSGSMATNNAIGIAKAELKASLQSLEKTQQFQIIFYNQKARMMSLRGRTSEGMYWADDINRTLASQFIAGIQADLGTRHMPALRRALELTPEVIFLLTDADEPRLTTKDFETIDRLNQGRARIHCIEFGKGGELGNVDNFLKRLARQNGGTYRYRDVSQFGRR